MVQSYFRGADQNGRLLWNPTAFNGGFWIRPRTLVHHRGKACIGGSRDSKTIAVRPGIPAHRELTREGPGHVPRSIRFAARAEWRSAPAALPKRLESP